jgi:outer membrane protein
MSYIIRGAIAGALATSLFVSGAALADEGSWMVRGRLTDAEFTNHNSDNMLPGKVEAQSVVFPELDVTYFFTPNLATELVLTYPQKHDITLDGTKIGSVRELPPHLMFQYHLPVGDFKPYVGVGVNYTHFWNVSILGGAVDVDRNSWGPSLQIGLDYKIAPQWYLNADVKYTWISTDVKVAGMTVDKLDLNPWILSFGFGYRF